MGKFLSNNKFPLVLFVVWRVVLFLVSFVSLSFLSFKATFPYTDYYLTVSNFPDWFWQFGNFDGVHYLGLATRGYMAEGTHVFFPLFPLLIRLVNTFFSNYLLSGLLVSNTAFLLALLVLFNYLKKNFSLSIAKWSLIFMVCFPTAFFFGSVYTESLFLFLVLVAFLTDRYSSALGIFLASLTKLLGIFAAISLLFDKPKRKYMLFGILGVGLYVLYTWLAYGNPMLIISDQQAFQNARASSLTSLVTPPQVIWRYLKIFMTGHLDRYDTWLAALEFISFVGTFILLVYLDLKKIFKRSWLVFSFFALIIPAVSGTFSSMPRYILVCFPIYIFFGRLNNTFLKLSILTVFIGLEAVLTTLFLRGYFVS